MIFRQHVNDRPRYFQYLETACYRPTFRPRRFQLKEKFVNTETPPADCTGLETVLVQIGRTDFGVDVTAREYRLHAAADRGFVLPVETLAVMKHGGFDVRDQRGPAESLRDDSLRDITKADDVALLDRRQGSRLPSRKIRGNGSISLPPAASRTSLGRRA